MKLSEFVNETNNGEIFSIKFKKRTTGEERKMVCRRGVHIGLTGNGPAYNATDKGLFTVFELGKEDPRKPMVKGGQYRNVPLDAIFEVTMGGKIYVKNEETGELEEIKAVEK